MSQKTLLTTVLSKVTLRCLRRPLSADLNAADVLSVADAMFAQLARIMREWPWPFLALPGRTVNVVNRTVTEADVLRSHWCRFYLREPTYPDDPCQRVTVQRTTDAGHVLAVAASTTSVWAEPYRAEPIFEHGTVPTGTLFAPYGVVYDHTAQTLYQEKLGISEVPLSGVTDAAKFDAKPTVEQDFVKMLELLTMADRLGHSEQERTQAADLEGQYQALLATLQEHYKFEVSDYYTTQYTS